MPDKPPKFSLKDHLFNPKKVQKIAAEIKAVHPAFKAADFTETVLKKFPELELKQRIAWIAETLRRFLPENYRDALTVLLNALPAPNDDTQSDDDFGDFIYAPYADFVAKFGCNKHDLDLSLNALKEITMRFSAEDAIRYFINAFPEKTLGVLANWTRDSHYHVRRLVSEGTRPKLPWAQKIALQPEQSLPLLDQLFSDRTRFVTRSVANHMNDISKIEPDRVLKTLLDWKKSKKQNPAEMEFIVKHALRTLVKKGYRGAIEFLDYSASPKVALSNLRIKENRIRIGQTLEFDFELSAQKSERLIIDYIMVFQNKKGKADSQKVFKLKQLELLENQQCMVSKKHRLLADMTTRKLYPGSHRIEILINGTKAAVADFELLPEV